MQTLNSFHANKQCGIMPGLHKNVDWRFPERPPLNTARDHSKEKATTPIWLSPRGKHQSTIQQNAANHHIFHTDHRQLTPQMHSTEEEPCPHIHSKRVGKSSTQSHSLWMQMIIAPNNVKRRSGTTYGPQTPPTHPFTLPPPNGVALLHLHNHVCLSFMFASNAGTQLAFRQTKIQHLRKTENMLAETTRLLNAPSNPSSRLFHAMKRNTGGSRVTEDGQWEQFSQRRKCQGVKQKRRREGSQWTSPATPDVRRLICATEK
ncbi:hypothetical protein TcCL_ESM09363 [Trypanosoma cruzi]|nr:hypothetical protein TcCL_ESM09363 [Trypanosoma cruzi]